MFQLLQVKDRPANVYEEAVKFCINCFGNGFAFFSSTLPGLQTTGPSSAPLPIRSKRSEEERTFDRALWDGMQWATFIFFHDRNNLFNKDRW
jgi:hypothetical protein